MDRGRILVVDDDQFYQEFATEILGEEGYQVRTTYTGEEALQLIKRDSFDVMLVDLIMPGMNGLELLERAKQVKAEVDVIIMTGHASVESAVQCLKSGAADYLTKPLNPEALKITVKRTIELRHLFDENAELRSLLTLYEGCQRISQCLEIDKLYGLCLDTLLQSLQCNIGLTFFNFNGEWGLKAWRGMEEEEAVDLMLDMIEHEMEQEGSDRVRIIEQPQFSRKGGPGSHLRAGAGLILPVRVEGQLAGEVAVFRKDDRPGLDRMDLGTARFISEQVHLSFENALNYTDAQRLAFIDDLTGLFNTRYLDMALDTELKRAKRFKASLSLLFIDLDYFKNVNDSHGHLAGSKLLIETGKVLKSCVREIDIIIRYGGDEFIVILIETDPKGAARVAERIREAVEHNRFRIKDDLVIKTTCCVGIATYPDDAENKSALIHLADQAMYRGKETTRNVVYAASTLF